MSLPHDPSRSWCISYYSVNSRCSKWLIHLNVLWFTEPRTASLRLMSLSISFPNNCPVSHSCPRQRIMVRAKTWILAKHFDGFPKDSDFELKVEELPAPRDGGEIIYFVSQILAHNVASSHLRHQAPISWNESVCMWYGEEEQVRFRCVVEHWCLFWFQRCFWRRCFSVWTPTWGECILTTFRIIVVYAFSKRKIIN